MKEATGQKSKCPNNNYKDTLNKSKDDFAAVLEANKNNAKQLPEYLQTLLEGSGKSIPQNTYPFTKPKWLDMEKLRQGQTFAMNNIFGVMTATGMTVVLGFAYKTILEPLIYSGNSSTPFTAFKRYSATITYVKTWYEGDLWQTGTVAHQNMKTVRGMHERIKKRLTDTPPEEFKQKSTLEGSGAPMWTDLHAEILEDFKSCPPLTTPIAGPHHAPVNQTDMALTQFAFVGFILTCPQMFGIHNATREELDGFAHLWRAIGHLLGIEDRFNVCSGDLETVQRRVWDIVDYWMKPLLRYVSRDWMHMARCMTEGLGLIAAGGSSFETSVLYLCKVIQVETPRLEASLSFKQKCIFKFNTFFLKYLIRVPGMIRLFNWLFFIAFKNAAELGKEDLNKLESIVYPYESESMCPLMR